MKRHLIVCAELGHERKIGPSNVSDTRRSAASLMIGHQDDQLSIRQQLDRAKIHGARYEPLPLGKRERIAYQPKSPPSRAGRSGQLRIKTTSTACLSACHQLGSAW